ncbi:uncharacterized protein TRIADDRAFT_56191 [Trichoplax adhaerens]|uniref:Uncharacterized protein n=1 Tax=Trichoplax adhaerens TaxID=10228 RepID=B3RXF6_TRIAD|nr:hypothetical protein TRIADDRAFT_56191 [Trichoplax adhaerens]EDV24413.1 hypothetical protein TRIADDRAFT_56191 [Trichoplax adhaerens]|eukprot:XP_002112303.1 hypothetical protein TRIADDRAFT_56191 [Trichoplax adhaerens]
MGPCSSSKMMENFKEIPKVETRGYPTMTKLEGLSKNDLVKQLKAEFQKLSDVNQEKCDLQEWEELAASLGTRQIMKHKDKDVRLYAACCLADIMRIFAPNAPYDTNLQSDILYLWIEQLRGLYNPNSQTFRRHYYILESLAYVQTFNVAIYMEAYDAIIDLFRLFFEIIRQVVNCMTMIMSSLVIDSEVIPQKLLDTILIQIIEPNKSQNKASYNLASQLITKTATSLEPYVQVFFTNCMTSEKASESEVSDRLYDIIYQLNSIAPSVLISVLPQLEYKLKSNEADERLDVTRLLARMFSDPESAVAKADSPLWKLLIGRFIDINASVRIECIRYAKYFLVYHPHFAKDTIEKLIVRSRDTDDKVRLEVVKIISEIAIEKLEAVTEELWDALKERMRDKKWIVRKEAMIKIAALYKSFKTKNEKNKYHKELQWMPNKLLHCYYQPGIEDRIFVEKIFRTALIPCNLKANDKILQLLNLQKVLDDHALRALNEIFRSKAIMRKHMMEFIQLVDKAKLEPDNEDMEPKTLAKKMVLSKMFPDSSKAHDQFRYIADSLYDQFFCNTFKKCFDPKTDCEKTLQAEVDILKDLSSRRISPEWMQILFDRCTSVTFDGATVQFLVKQIPKIAKSMSADDQQKLAQNDSGSNEFSRCTQMLQSVSILMPTLFTSKSCQEEILQMLESQMISIVDLALRVLVNCAKEIKIDECPVKSFFQPKLIKFATNGTPAQAKLSMKCIATLCKDSVVIMERIHGTLLKSLQVESKMLLTTLTSLAQIATFAPGVFEKNSLEIVREFVVKKIVTVDGGFVNTHQYLPANFAVTPNKKRIVRGSPTKKVATTPKKSSASESNTPLKRKLISTPKSSFDFNNTSDDSDNDLNHSVRSPPKKVNVSSTPAAKPRGIKIIYVLFYCSENRERGRALKTQTLPSMKYVNAINSCPKGRKAVEKMAEEFGSEGSNENRESSSDIVSPDSEEELASSISSNDETSDDEDQKVSHSRRSSATSPKKKLKSDKRKPSKQSKSKVESKSVSKRSTNVTESIKVEKSPTQAGTESSGKTQNQKSHINEDTARRARGRRKKEITDVDDKGKVEAKQPEKKSDRTSRSKQSSKKKDAVAVEKEHAIALDTHKSDSPLNIQSKKETSLRKGAAKKADGKVVSKPSQKERSSRSQSRQSTTRKASNTSKAKEESISTVTKRGSAASRSRKKIEKKKVNEPVAKKESLTETKEDTAKMEDSDDSDSSDYVEASSKMKTTEKKSKSAAKSSKATPKTVPRRKATTVKKKADKQQKLFKGNPPRNVGCASCS